MTTNRPVHFEILCNDPQELMRFYQSVFDWEIESYDSPEEYWLVKTGDGQSPGIDGGFMRRHFPQAVINTTAVNSLDDSVARVQGAGGKLIHGPYDIPGVGRHVYCTDPEGNIFGIIQEAPEA